MFGPCSMSGTAIRCWAWVNMEAAAARLQDAERWLESTATTTEMVVVDHEQFKSLLATIAIGRAATFARLVAILRIRSDTLAACSNSHPKVNIAGVARPP